jgi:L-ascorbate metabolism protein UlaG (beta-lactamase superfamily)
MAARLRKVRALVSHLREKTNALRRGGLDTENENQVGLFPAKGALRRNYQFVRHVLVPQIFTPRTGASLRPDLLNHESSDFQVTWIGHASFLIQTEGVNLLIDPVWARWLGLAKRARHPGLAIEDLPPIHAVLITHAHFDHLHRGALKRIAAGQPIIVPHGLRGLVRRYPFSEVIELAPWETLSLGPLTITHTPAKHWGARVLHDVHRGFGGYLVENSQRAAVYHCGDSAYFDGFAAIGAGRDIRLALLSIGAYKAPSGRCVHMTPEEALTAFSDLSAHRMAPMHYGTFPLGGEPMDEPLARLREAARVRDLTDAVHIFDEGRPQTFPPRPIP